MNKEDMKKYLFTMDEVFEWEDPEWLIDGFVHRGSSVFFSGPPKTGKSLFALRLAAAVTSGTEVGGKKAQKGKVVYIAAERAKLMKPRSMALIEQGIPFESDNMRVFAKPIPFLNDQEVKEFAELVGPTDLLIVDTLRRCFLGGKENDNNDMTMWATGVELFCELTGAAGVVIHHNHREYRDKLNRPMESDYAGGGSLLGSLDGQFSLRPKDNHVVEVAVAGANEGNNFRAFFKSVPVMVGKHQTWVMLDEDGVIEEEKQLLEPLARAILQNNPEQSVSSLYELCKEDTEIKEYWPDLSKESVRKIVKKWHTNNEVNSKPNPKHSQQELYTWV